MIEQLRLSGFTRLTLAVGYLSHLIEAVFGDGSAHGVSIDYHHELSPLGTAGALAGVDGPRRAVPDDERRPHHDTRLLGALSTPTSRAAIALTIATQERTATIDFGVLMLGEESGPTQPVVGYVEKPTSRHVVSMGIYVVDPSLLRLITPGAYLDFPDLVLKAMAAGEQVGAYSYDGLWLDIGRHEDYERACTEFADVEALLRREDAPAGS